MLLANPKEDKEQTRLNILNCIVASEVSKGHLKWKVSEIARQAEVSRPLIYYYFGKTKKQILTECLNAVAKEYYGLTPECEKLLKEGLIVQSISKVHAIHSKNPAVGIFYQMCRTKESSFKNQILDIELAYQQKLRSAFPQLSEGDAIAVHAIFMGLVTSPFLTSEALNKVVEVVGSYFLKKKEAVCER